MDLFSLVARLTLDTSDYTNKINTAQTAGKGAKLDISGNITAKDGYTGTLGKAETAAHEAGVYHDLDAEGTITADDQFSGALSAAEGKASSFDGDAEGEITADDNYSDILASLESEASSSDLDVDGEAKLNTTDYDRSMKSAKDQATQLDGILKGLKIGAVVAGIGKVTNWVAGAVNDTVAYADTVDKAAQKFSISRGTYQQWSHALGQSGADMNTFQRGLLNMTKLISGSASEDVTAAFSALGIDASQYGAGDTERLLSDTVMALAGMGEGADRDALVTQIFGMNGTALNALLNSGAEGVQQLIDEANELGLVMSDEDIEKNVKLGDAISNLQESAQSLIQTLVTDIAPALTEIANFFTQVIGGVKKFLGIADEAQAAYDSMYTPMEDKLQKLEIEPELYVTVEFFGGHYYPVYDSGVDYTHYYEGSAGDYTLVASEAKGQWDVPYDDYAAYLHRDEMVLTASQARRYRDGDSDNSMVAEAISGLRNDIKNLQIVVGEKVFGRTVVQYGGRRMSGYIGEAEDKLIAGYGWG